MLKGTVSYSTVLHSTTLRMCMHIHAYTHTYKYVLPLRFFLFLLSFYLIVVLSLHLFISHLSLRFVMIAPFRSLSYPHITPSLSLYFHLSALLPYSCIISLPPLSLPFLLHHFYHHYSHHYDDCHIFTLFTPVSYYSTFSSPPPPPSPSSL